MKIEIIVIVLYHDICLNSQFPEQHDLWGGMQDYVLTELRKFINILF